MEVLHYLRYMLQQGDYMFNLDMKDSHFSVALHRNCRDKVRFQWSGKLYEFLCLCFGSGPAPRIFIKILKVSISPIRRLNIRIVIYLDNMLLLGRSIKEVLIAAGTAIFLLQHLEFVIDLKKSILTPQQKIESTSGFSQYDIVFDSRGTDEIDQRMFGDVQDRESVHFTIDKAHRSFKFNSARSVTSTNSVLVFTINSGRIAQSRPFIPTSSNLEFQCNTGTSLVGPKRKTVEWKMSCSTPSTNGGSNGCF